MVWSPCPRRNVLDVAVAGTLPPAVLWQIVTPSGVEKKAAGGGFRWGALRLQCASSCVPEDVPLPETVHFRIVTPYTVGPWPARPVRVLNDANRAARSHQRAAAGTQQ